jgi:hypothetical protein
VVKSANPVARSMTRKLGDCNAQELANTAWGFAKADYLVGLYKLNPVDPIA